MRHIRCFAFSKVPCARGAPWGPAGGGWGALSSGGVPTRDVTCGFIKLDETFLFAGKRKAGRRLQGFSNSSAESTLPVQFEN